MNDNRIGVVVATALSVTTVVGAGLLVLPGLSFSIVGRAGYVPWVAVAVLMLPLLYVFSYFAANNPSAGGAVGYIRASLGPKTASMAEMIVLGTFSLGIPAIALIGADYLVQSIPGMTVMQAGLAMIGLSYGAGLVGLKVSGAIQTVVAVCIVVGLVGITVAFLLSVDWQAAPVIMSVGESRYEKIASAIPVVLFAFTGWEMTAFLAEDMKNPGRDMPRSIWISFFIVVALYVFIAWAVAHFAENSEEWKRTPFIEMAHHFLGKSGGVAVGVVAACIGIANVVAAFLSASRAVYSAGRDGFLPGSIGRMNVAGKPVVAMTVTWLLFSVVICAACGLNIGFRTLLQLAGQNFFVLYLLCSAGFVRLNHGKQSHLIIGSLAIVSVLMMLMLFSLYGVIYCSVLALLGLFLSRRKSFSS